MPDAKTNDDSKAGLPLPAAGTGSAAATPIEPYGERKHEDGDRRGNGRGVEQEREMRFVCGVGASAGGFSALVELFGNLRFDHMAFVVVQHLPPDHQSLLPELLGRVTEVKVIAAADGQALYANTIYVAPPHSEVAVLDGKLRLWPVQTDARSFRPIDYFLQSLANDQGQRAVGVVLSGAGSDGTVGLQAVRVAGGVTFAQDPATAKFASMPASAERGGADFVLAPKKIASELHALGRSGGIKRRSQKVVQREADFAKLVVLLRNACRLDLNEYKFSMLERRVERRMALNKVEELTDYLELLQQSRSELNELAGDVLINVTRFFRGQDLYELMRRQIFPRLLHEVPENDPIRLWSVGCATGQEPYSMAMALLDAMDAEGKRRKVQIFATDIDERALAVARKGRYPESHRMDLGERATERYFWCKGAELHLKREVRDMVIFSRQNILCDPPFRRLHVVSCRNLLIYLQSAAQRRVISTLHYALRKSGTLVLGEAESVGEAPELFTLVDRSSKAYSRNTDPRRGRLPISNAATTHLPARRELLSQTRIEARSTRELVDDKLLHAWCAPGVITDEQLQVLEFRGEVGRYLALNAGGASLNLMRLAPTVLHSALRTLVSSLPPEGASLTTSCLLDGNLRQVTVRVLGVDDVERSRRYFYIGFTDMPMPAIRSGEERGSSDSEADARRLGELDAQGTYCKGLERELATTKESLGHALEAKEVAVEELKNFSEEAQSANEELQSANEELETSKEEVQSANEELIVVNEELQVRMLELSTMQDELFHLLAQVEVPVLTVGSDLRLRRYSAAAATLFDISSVDVARPVDYVKRFFTDLDLRPLVQAALDEDKTQQVSAVHVNGDTYDLRVSSFGNLQRPGNGCLIFLRPVTESSPLRRVVLRVSEHADERWAKDVRPMFICSARGRGIWINESMRLAYGLSAAQFVGKSVYRGVLGHKLGAELQSHLMALRDGRAALDAEHRVRAANGGEDVVVRARAVKEGSTRFFRIVLDDTGDG